MKKNENNLVNKEWHRWITKLLTEDSQSVSSLFTKLLTMQHSQEEPLKVARRLRGESRKNHLVIEEQRSCLRHVFDGIKYGWAFGLSGRTTRITRLQFNSKDRRLKATMAIAVQAGVKIGFRQYTEMQKGASPKRRLHGAKPPQIPFPGVPSPTI